MLCLTLVPVVTVETMADRFTLVSTLRDKIYSVHITVLQKLSKLCKETVKPEELTRITALKVIEDFIEITAKDEDEGVKILTDLCEALEKIIIFCQHQHHLKAERKN